MKLLIRLAICIMSSFVIACEESIPEILVGYQIIESDSIMGDFFSDYNVIAHFDQDSVEYVPLWQGCIIAPAYKRKYKIRKDDDCSKYIANERDTLRMNFEHVVGNIYANRVNRTEYQYISAFDVRLGSKESAVIEAFQEKSFEFSMDNEVKKVTFHDKEFVMNRKIKDEEFKIEGSWFIEKVGDYYFLIIDDYSNILKFQIDSITENLIKVHNLNAERGDPFIFLKLIDGYTSPQNGRWISKTKEEFHSKRLELQAFNSSSEHWLLQNDAFIVNDTSTTLIAKSESVDAVYVDRNTNTIIVDYGLSFNYSVDILNNSRIRLHPVDENGKINQNVSKVFWLE